MEMEREVMQGKEELRPGSSLMGDTSQEGLARRRIRTSNTHTPEMLISARPVIALPTRRLVRAPGRMGIDVVAVGQRLVAAGDRVQVIRVETVIVEFGQDAFVGPIVRLGGHLAWLRVGVVVLVCGISRYPTSRRRNAPRLHRPFALLPVGALVRSHRRCCVSGLYRLGDCRCERWWHEPVETLGWRHLLRC